MISFTNHITITIKLAIIYHAERQFFQQAKPSSLFDKNLFLPASIKIFNVPSSSRRFLKPQPTISRILFSSLTREPPPRCSQSSCKIHSAISSSTKNPHSRRSPLSLSLLELGRDSNATATATKPRARCIRVGRTYVSGSAATLSLPLPLPLSLLGSFRGKHTPRRGGERYVYIYTKCRV